MSSNGTRQLEAWLVLAGMLAAMAWYARPQLGYSLATLRLAVEWILGAAAR
jgi:hypothetical protein